LSVEDIVLLPDDRAGARVVMNNQTAYLTFVVQDGEGKVGIWDNPWESYPDATATP